MDDVRRMRPTRARVGDSEIDLRSAAQPAQLHVHIAAMLVMASLLLLVGCGAASVSSGSAGSASSATTNKLCQGITKVNQSLKQVEGISSSTTVGVVKADQQKLTTALNALAKLPGGGGSTISKLESANSQLAAAISGLPDNAPIGQASQQLQTFQAQISKAQAGVTKLGSTLHCAS